MSINLFDDSFYAGGGGIAEGDYALEFTVQMYQPTDRSTGAARGRAKLGVVVKFYPIDEEGSLVGEPREKFYGMGTKAHESFAPDAETGKGLVQVPGGKFSTLMGNTNWALLRQSMKDAGVPFSELPANDLSALDGVWVHAMNVPEPEERKAFRSNTADVEAEDEIKGSGLVTIVSEIKENGKPWEGSGGIPAGAEEEKPQPLAKPTPKPAPKPAAGGKPGLKVAPKPAPKPAKVEEEDSDDVMTLVVSAISEVLEANPKGVKKLKLRTGVFTAADGEHQEAVMGIVTDDKKLSAVLEQLGYQLKGIDILPA